MEATQTEVSRITLTEDQSRALEQIIDWFKGGFASAPAMLLSGHAGTGKSTLVQEVVRFLLDEGESVCLTAPTNKATRVLQSMAERAGLRVPCMTAYSANGLRLADDDADKYVVKSHAGQVDQYRLVVADEASMIGPRLFQEFVDATTTTYGCKVLFVGDPLQLPPVKEEGAPAFELGARAELTTIVRQAADNPIIVMGDWLRKLVRGEKPGPMPAATPVDKPGVHLVNRGEFEARYVYTLTDRASKGEAGACRGVAFRNDIVDRMASTVRRALYGDPIPPYVQGELVYAAAPWGQMKIDFESRVTLVLPVQKHMDYPDWDIVPLRLEPHGWRVYDEDGDSSSSRQLSASAIHPDVREDWDRHIQNERRKILDDQQRIGRNDNIRRAWSSWHKFNDAFASLRSVHAITAHRSQGSTFDEVFVNVPDIQGAARLGGEAYKYRLLYVAITRARDHAWLLW